MATNFNIVSRPEEIGTILLEDGQIVIVELITGTIMCLGKSGYGHSILNPVLASKHSSKPTKIARKLMEAGIIDEGDIEAYIEEHYKKDEMD